MKDQLTLIARKAAGTVRNLRKEGVPEGAASMARAVDVYQELLWLIQKEFGQAAAWEVAEFVDEKDGVKGLTPQSIKV